MTANYERKYDLEDIESVFSAEFNFDANLPVSRSSKYGDSIWMWDAEHNANGKILSLSKVSIEWDSYTIGSDSCRKVVEGNKQEFVAILPPKIIEDIKRAAFMYATFPGLIKPRTKRVKGITIIYFAKAILNFFSFIYIQNIASYGKSTINSVSDIKSSDIEDALAEYPYELERLKENLNVFSLTHVSENLRYGPVSWNRSDLKNIFWKPKKHRGNIKPLPDDLFVLLSGISRSLILEFLLLVGEDINDNDPILLKEIVKKKRFDNFSEIINDYIKRREIIRDQGAGYVSPKTKEFKEKFNFLPVKIRDFLFDVHCAAQAIILLYTGMRYSEAALLKKGCLIKRGNISLIKSKISKGRPNNSPIIDDEFVAIDLVQDAIKTLEIISEFTFNDYLFANFTTVKDERNRQPLSNGGLSQRLNKYLRRFDFESKWRDWKLSTHQFRHGLVWQLARAEVGLPYITRQLHHFHSTIYESSKKISEVTTVYGMQKERLIANETGLNAAEDARFGVINDLFGEGKKFAGGGAAKHVAKTEAFFTGMGISGKNRDEYLKRLAKSGVTPIRTGVGWCMRNHLLQAASNEGVPDCIGDLQCNPHYCKYSVVSKTRQPDVIRMYLDSLRKLRDPQQSYQKTRWEKVRDSFAAMLEDLGVDISTLSAD